MMLSKKYFCAIAAAAIMAMPFFGGATAWAEEEADQTLVEGYTVEDEGFTSVVTWTKNGDMNIYGKFYYPEGFDESQTYPTVIMSHGLGSKAEMVERAQWPQAVVKEGFVVYAFDYCGGGRNSNSDGDYMNMSIMTEKSDLNAVMDFVKGQSFVDNDNLFLFGQSQGGMVSALTAAERPDDVKAMVLVYPAFCIVHDLHEFIPDLNEVTGDVIDTAMGQLGAIYAKDAYDLDVMETIAGYDGDVMIIHGLADNTVPYEFSVEAMNTAYAEANSELLLLTGKSVHGFEMVYDEGRETALQAGKEFLVKHLGDAEEE